ncbi:hypothetical protein RJ639_003848 [Escallonia herrerae]|uniref:Uncharacterized protein n=1 Tax=Escallonia herrerae TaxID=1293975 RepID=A0AA88W296_9ASTE|nr:hypothetical protein RJ639_003848 [Escallonia herrerae]
MSTARGPLTLTASWSLSDPGGRNAFHMKSVRARVVSGIPTSRFSASIHVRVLRKALLCTTLTENEYSVSHLEKSKLVLRCSSGNVMSQPVIDGDHHGRNRPRKSAAHGVVRLTVRAEVDEPATVEEHDDGELAGGGGDVDAEPEAARRVDGDVEGLDAVDGVGARGALEAEHAEEAAVHGAVAAAGGVGDGGDQRKGNARLPWKRERGRRSLHDKRTHSGRERERVVVTRKVCDPRCNV